MSKEEDCKIVSKEIWVKERLKLLEEEKEFGKKRIELAEKRRNLPWIKLEKDYLFIGKNGEESLSELFINKTNEKYNSLVVQHFMFDSGSDDGCPLCSFWVDGLNGIYSHIKQRSNYILVGKAPFEKLEQFRLRKGWDVPFFSSFGTTFNSDFAVECPQDHPQGSSSSNWYNYGKQPWQFTQAPGISIFVLGSDGKSIYHTYSTFGPGLVELNACFGILDALPDGRNEEGKRNMYWVKHKEDY